MHLRQHYLLCQIVCLSSDFEREREKQSDGVGGVFTVVHRETDFFSLVALSFFLAVFREENCPSLFAFSRRLLVCLST
jgi:hypothetical protein